MTTSDSREQVLATAPAGSEGTGKAGKKPARRAGKARVAAGRRKPAARDKGAKKKGHAPQAGPKAAATGARDGSKTATVIGLLEASRGATLAELIEASGWQPHSVRGFISGVLRKKMGLKINSARREDGQRAYSIPK